MLPEPQYRFYFSTLLGSCRHPLFELLILRSQLILHARRGQGGEGKGQLRQLRARSGDLREVPVWSAPPQSAVPATQGCPDVAACDVDALTSDSVQSPSSSAVLLVLLPEMIDHRPYAEPTNAGDVRLQPIAVYRLHPRRAHVRPGVVVAPALTDFYISRTAEAARGRSACCRLPCRAAWCVLEFLS